MLCLTAFNQLSVEHPLPMPMLDILYRARPKFEKALSMKIKSEMLQLAAPKTSGGLSTRVQRFDFWDRLGN